MIYKNYFTSLLLAEYHCVLIKNKNFALDTKFRLAYRRGTCTALFMRSGQCAPLTIQVLSKITQIEIALILGKLANECRHV